MKNRREFWKEKLRINHEVWFIIKEAIQSDLAQCDALLSVAGFKCENGTVDRLIDPKGNKHDVPIWLINKPINYSASYHAEKLREIERPSVPEGIEVKILDSKTSTKHEYTISNSEDCSELKRIYGEEYDCSDISKIRLFYLGKEMENDVCINSYNIKSNIYICGLVIDE
ncbi:unnamed protein product [Moneuplotes crassus]|uniref:Ubiquitin-like domain-containing protein n=1 Tax=Euplotes crassus TaxID=5936 RepID=A0AAD1XV19_EUPCR|nr:unnamed protein product [Moneuplotes crassus]